MEDIYEGWEFVTEPQMVYHTHTDVRAFPCTAMRLNQPRSIRRDWEALQMGDLSYRVFVTGVILVSANSL